MKLKNQNKSSNKTSKSPVLLSQAEIIRKINRNTRRSYKLFKLLFESRNDYEPGK